MLKNYQSSRCSDKGYVSNPNYPEPSDHSDGKEYVWQQVKRKRGLSVEDYKTRYIWGGSRVDIK